LQAHKPWECYTLGLDQLVRDIRTGRRTARLDLVLEGHLDAYLQPPDLVQRQEEDRQGAGRGDTERLRREEEARAPPGRR
jgi:hypothetical protein